MKEAALIVEVSEAQGKLHQVWRAILRDEAVIFQNAGIDVCVMSSTIADEDSKQMLMRELAETIGYRSDSS